MAPGLAGWGGSGLPAGGTGGGGRAAGPRSLRNVRRKVQSLLVLLGSVPFHQVHCRWTRIFLVITVTSWAA
jgi:hypothetical protein